MIYRVSTKSGYIGNFTIYFIYLLFFLPRRRGHVEWSSCSPDLSPLDFFFWGMLKEKVYSMKITDLNHMRERITSQCAEIDGNADLFHRAHLNFAKRIKLCIENDGNHVENIIYQH